MNKYYDVIIVGAGHGGAHTAIQLRVKGFEGSIALISDDPNLPYERPPLSKEYMAGEKTFDRLLFRTAELWKEKNINLMLGQTVKNIYGDGTRYTIICDGPSGPFSLECSKLVWAAGGSARPLVLPGSKLENIHSIRNRSDVDRLRSLLPTTERVVIVGGGYIGLESAAVYRKLGKSVVLLEAQDRVLARVAGEKLSGFYQQQHRSHDVDIRLGVTISEFIGHNGKVSAVLLKDGTETTCDQVIVGIGILPNIGPLLAAGADGGNGVLVNNYCETTLPNIYAVGDCALHENPFAAENPIRLECVQNAVGMADCVAENILGNQQPYDELPWFWSNQYDLKLQTVGISTGYDKEVLRGSLELKKFSLVYYRQGKVIALDCVNNPADFIQAKKLMKSDLSMPEDKVSDIARPLKECVE